MLAKSNSSGIGLSFLTLRFSSLFLVDSVAGEGDTPLGEVGEMPPGVCTFDGGLEVPSDSSAMELFLDFAPRRLFFCLNLASQLLLFAFRWLSEWPTVVAKKRAFSRMMASFNGRPDFRWFFTQLDRHLSMSGNLPFDLFMGDRLPSS